MDPTRYFASHILTQDLERKPKSGDSYLDMTLGQISLFKLSTSTGNDFEHPVRPNERFSGVLVVQLTRPLQASQVVLEFVGTERHLTALKGTSKFAKTPIFTVDLVVWRPANSRPGPTSMLSEGIHVFNFSCQMPHVNYPQSMQSAEYAFTYTLRGKVMVPLDHTGDRVAALVEKELYYAPIITQAVNPDPLNLVETLYFEKKGKKGKPAVELRAAITGHQVTPGSKMKIDMSIKELSSTNWTKVVARLFERTNCRESTKGSFSQPAWSIDRELLSTELVRSSVYNFFITDDVIGKNNTETTSSEGETITSEILTLDIPHIPCSPLGSDHLEFRHYMRLEVILPTWISSDRSVYTEFPVQLMTCDPHSAIRLLNRQASLVSLERNYVDGNSETASRYSNQSNGMPSNRPQSPLSSYSAPSMSLESRQAIVNSLPPTYHDVHPVQRPLPMLSLLKQVNASTATDSTLDMGVSQRTSKQSRSTRHTTMSSSHRSELSFDGKSIGSSQGTSEDPAEEKYRARPLPNAPVTPITPPPLPSAPMPGTAPPGVPPPLPTAPMPGSAMLLPPPLPSAPMPNSAPPYPSTQMYASQQHSPRQAAPLSAANAAGFEQHRTQRFASSPHPYAINGTPLSVPSYTPNSVEHASYDSIAAQYSAPPSGGNQGYHLNIPAATDMSMLPPSVLQRGMSLPNASKPGKNRPLTAMPPGRPRSPISPPQHEPMMDDAESDDDAGYFKASTAKRSLERERSSDKGFFRLRKNSSIKHTR